MKGFIFALILIGFNSAYAQTEQEFADAQNLCDSIGRDVSPQNAALFEFFDSQRLTNGSFDPEWTGLRRYYEANREIARISDPSISPYSDQDWNEALQGGNVDRAYDQYLQMNFDPNLSCEALRRRRETQNHSSHGGFNPGIGGFVGGGVHDNSTPSQGHHANTPEVCPPGSGGTDCPINTGH